MRIDNNKIFYGYKCFNKGLINRKGRKFETGKIYHTIGKVKYGNKGNGFHVAKHLEDTLKFFTKDDDKGNTIMNEDIDIAYVKCYGNYDDIPNTYANEYAGDYDMYAYEYMEIEKVLTREEIIKYALNLYSDRLQRFLMYFKLTDEEKEMFKQIFKNNNNILDYIAYYQDNDKELFQRKKVK